MRRGKILACTIATFGAGGAAHTANTGLTGVLKDQAAIDGCSWSATSTSLGKALIFLAEYDESVVIMNIGGNDVHLQLDPQASAGALETVGSHLTRAYVAPGIRVEAAYTATWICPAKDDSCEVTKFKVIYKVTVGGATQVVEGRGDVGC